jgi:exopolysaccharide biosynthesis polyprenyl glycosylphosphotransferase
MTDSFFFPATATLGHAGPSSTMAVIHHAVLSATGYAPHALLTLGPDGLTCHAAAMFAAGALWTAVPLPSGPARFPLRRVLAAVGAAAAVAAVLGTIALIVHLTPPRPPSGGLLSAVELLAFCALAVGAVTVAFRTPFGRHLFERPILVVGVPPRWAEVDALIDPGYGPLFRVTDIVPATAWHGHAGDFLRRERIWGVVLAEGQTSAAADIAQRCRRTGIQLLREEEFREQWLGRVDIDHLDPQTIAAWRIRHRRPDRLFGRRGVDIALSVLLLLFTLPLMLLVAFLIRIDSAGPVFYRQERVGLGGRPFRLIKFRSMRTDAEAQSGPQWAGPTDPRVTRIGGFLRLTRIDELPQLWNVLRGEMSVIGPRPERPFFVEQLAATIPSYNERCVIKPGITGWAQVNYRYGASTEDARVKLSYDLYYVKHRSYLLDLRILAATVRVVLLQKGAR